MPNSFFDKYLNEDICKSEETSTDECISSSSTSQCELSDNYNSIHEEYTKMIETNDCLAKQYEACRQQKDTLIEENERLKQSLKECENMLQRRMTHDNNTFHEMETIHCELNRKYKSSQAELKRINEIVQTQNKEINDLKESICKKQINQTQNSDIDIDIEMNHDLNGSLAESLTILNNEFNESLSPQMFTLWKKFIFALMQHFENKLCALKQSENIHPIANIYYQEPRVIVKYKKTKKGRKKCSKSLKKKHPSRSNSRKTLQKIEKHKKKQQFRF